MLHTSTAAVYFTFPKMSSGARYHLLFDESDEVVYVCVCGNHDEDDGVRTSRRG